MNAKIVASLCLLVFLFSCRENDLPQEIEKGLLRNKIINIEGEEREYHLFLPKNLSNCSVVFLLHGNGGSSDDVIGDTGVKSPFKVWLTLAAENNLIVIIPNGNKGSSDRRGWNDCREETNENPTSNDVLFLNNLLTVIQTTYNTNSKKTFVVGMSNGGFMAIRLTQEIPQKITAFASITAPMPVNSKCINSTIPVSALFMNGTDDPIIPYNGGQMAFDRGEVFSANATINYWIERNGSSNQPIFTDFTDSNTNDNCRAESYLYKNSGTLNNQVMLYKILNGGHTEPSKVERYNSFFLNIVGNQNGDIEMSEEIWNFFKDKSK